MVESEITSLIGKLEDRYEFGTVLTVKGDKDVICHLLRLLSEQLLPQHPEQQTQKPRGPTCPPASWRLPGPCPFKDISGQPLHCCGSSHNEILAGDKALLLWKEALPGCIALPHTAWTPIWE